jgi:hypothetical protein
MCSICDICAARVGLHAADLNLPSRPPKRTLHVRLRSDVSDDAREKLSNRISSLVPPDEAGVLTDTILYAKVCVCVCARALVRACVRACAASYTSNPNPQFTPHPSPLNKVTAETVRLMMTFFYIITAIASVLYLLMLYLFILCLLTLMTLQDNVPLDALPLHPLSLDPHVSLYLLMLYPLMLYLVIFCHSLHLNAQVLCLFMLYVNFDNNIRDNRWEFGVLRALGLDCNQMVNP